MRTEVASTGADGTAAVTGMVWNRLPGAFQIRVTAMKGDVRAGTVLSQYISDIPQSKSAGIGRSNRKLITFAVMVGAGAAAGIVLGRGGRSSQPSNAGPAPLPPQIGMPTILIGTP
jgi:hypothetical protein